MSWKQCIHQTVRNLDVTAEDAQDRDDEGLSSLEGEIGYVFGRRKISIVRKILFHFIHVFIYTNILQERDL